MIISKIRTADKQYSLFGSTKLITVACSGGADSMALLHALKNIAPEYGFSLKAAHFNHHIRGEEANRDEAFVKDYCQNNNIEFVAGHGNVPEYAAENNLSIELAARKLRYDFLLAVSNGGVVATAHHAGDNLETMLFNLARGTALAGLCGIPAKRDIYIRPLILCSREEIEDYCEKNGIGYVTDSTNLSDEYSRNRLRHRVVPELKTIRPSVEAAAARTAQSLAEDEEFLSQSALEEYKKRYNAGVLDIECFDKLPRAIAKRVLKKYWFDKLGENPDFLHITEMYDCCINGGKYSLPHNMYAVSKSGKLCVESVDEITSKDFSVEISEENTEIFPKNQKVHNLLLKNSIDCDKIVGKLVLRTREEGDRVFIKGRGGTKTLKKLYNEYKIPLCERENLPILADENGIVWIAKIGVAERCAVNEKTQRMYKVSFATKEGKNDG